MSFIVYPALILFVIFYSIYELKKKRTSKLAFLTAWALVFIFVSWVCFQYNRQDKRFFRAVSNGNLEKIERILDDGINVNIRYKGILPEQLSMFSYAHNGDTALMFAVFSRDKDVAYKMSELLIKNGANVNFKNPRTNDSPLSKSLRNPKILSLLVKNGANTKVIPNKYTKRNLLHICALNTQGYNKCPFDSFEILINSSVNICAKDFKGKTVLDYLVEKKREKLMLTSISCSKSKKGLEQKVSHNIICRNCKKEFKFNEEVFFYISNVSEEEQNCDLAIKIFVDGKWKLLSDCLDGKFRCKRARWMSSKSTGKIVWHRYTMLPPPAKLRKEDRTQLKSSPIASYNLEKGALLRLFLWKKSQLPHGVHRIVHEFKLLPKMLED